MVLFTWLHGGHHTAVQNRKTGWFLDFASSNARSTSATLCGRTHSIPAVAGLAAAVVACGAASGAFEQADTRAMATSSRERIMIRLSRQAADYRPAGSALSARRRARRGRGSARAAGVSASARFARSSHRRRRTPSSAERLRAEGVRFAVAEDPALQLEAALRVDRQRRPVLGAGQRAVAARAQVALGIDVQPDRLQHGRAEQVAQEGQRDVLVTVVDAAQRRRLALVVDEVAEVVQEGRDDQLVAGAVLFGQVSRLQRVLKLRDRLAGVHAVALGGEQPFDVVERQRHVSSRQGTGWG